jgi:hypothetical protein
MSRRLPTTGAAGRALLLTALLAGLGLAVSAGARAPVVAPPAEAGPAYLFLSPNRDEGVSAAEATRRLRSPDQAHFRGLAADILQQVGAGHARVLDAVGDWSDGSENSLLAVIPGRTDASTLRYAAGWFGLLAQQKGVLAFRPAAGGPDAVAVLDLPQRDLEQVRRLLDRHGIRDRTLLLCPDGHRVVVYDEGRRLRAPLERLARHPGAVVRVTAGHGEALGEADRVKARERYRAVIHAYEDHPRRPRYRPSLLPPLVRHARKP